MVVTNLTMQEREKDILAYQDADIIISRITRQDNINQWTNFVHLTGNECYQQQIQCYINVP